MAGMPELNSVYGTYSGLQGLDLTPLQMKQRQRMFLAQLAQEQQESAAQQQLAGRGLDLEAQALASREKQAALERTFQENLLKMRSDFDTQQQQRQIQAATESQQRAIQEAQRSQGSAQDFAGAQGEIERTFRREENTANRDLEREQMAERSRQFAESLGFEREKFDFGREITLKDEGRKERAEKLNTELAEIQMRAQRGEIDQRQAQTALILKQVELVGLELAEAASDAGLTEAQLGEIAGIMASGEDLPDAIAGKLMKSPKAIKSVMALNELMNAASERGLMPAKRASLEAQTEAQKVETEAVKNALAAKEAPPETEGLTPDETSTLRDLTRKQEAGELGDVGKARLKAVGEIATLSGATDADAVDRRNKLRAFSELSRGLEGEDISDLSPDAVDGLLALTAIPTFGTTLLPLIIKYGVKGIDRLSEDEKQAAVREMADELGLAE